MAGLSSPCTASAPSEAAFAETAKLPSRTVGTGLFDVERVD